MKKMCISKDAIRVVETSQSGKNMGPDVKQNRNSYIKYKTDSEQYANYEIQDKLIVNLSKRYNGLSLSEDSNGSVFTDTGSENFEDKEIVYKPVSYANLKTARDSSFEDEIVKKRTSKSEHLEKPNVRSKRSSSSDSKLESKSSGSSTASTVSSSKSKKSRFSLFKRHPALRQRSHSINIIEQPVINRSLSSDEYESSSDRQMDPVIPKTKGPGSRTGSTHTDTSTSSTKSLRYLQRRGSRGSSSSVGSLTEENIPRLVFIGDQRVGKTAMINRFTRGAFLEQCKTMVSPVVTHTKFVYYASIDKDVQVQFWDVDGGETQTAIDSCLKSHAVVVVYDITNRSSFQKAQFLLESINPRISALLIGNKLDLRASRKVTYVEGRLLSKIHRVQYVETSCKDDYNVEEALQLLLATIPKEYMRRRNPKMQMRSKSETQMNVSSTCNVCHRKLPKIPTSQSPHAKDEIEI